MGEVTEGKRMGRKEELVKKHGVSLKNNILHIDDNDISISGYQLNSVIGNGANAIIVKATGDIAKEPVAIKIWMKNKSKKDDGNKYKEEIKKMANLTLAPNNYNKHLIRYYASGVINDYFYCVMEYLDIDKFITLREYLSANKQMPLEARYSVLSQVVSGLRFAHENNIYHGDLHGENILIDKKNLQVKIIDFGTSFFNKQFSRIRDNKMMLRLCSEILNSFWDKKILLFFKVEPENLPPQVIRLIMKAVNKIIALLDLWEKGPVSTIAEDIASFSVLVPFFSIKHLEERMFKGEELEELRDLFRETLWINLTEIFRGMDKTNESIEVNYVKCQEKFIDFCEKNPYEQYIYLNYEQAKAFNSSIYEGHYGLTEQEIEREAIKAIIE